MKARKGFNKKGCNRLLRGFILLEIVCLYLLVTWFTVC